MTWVRPTRRQMSTVLAEVLHDVQFLGSDPDYDSMFDHRIFAMWPDPTKFEAVKDPHDFWVCSDGTVGYKATSPRSGTICGYFVPGGYIPRYSRDLGDVVKLIKRVCVPKLNYSLDRASDGRCSARVTWYPDETSFFRGVGTSPSARRRRTRVRRPARSLSWRHVRPRGRGRGSACCGSLGMKDLLRDVEALGADPDFDHQFDLRMHNAFLGSRPGAPVLPYTRDLSAAVSLIKSVLGEPVCFAINSTEDTVACTIWRAGPERRMYAGFQIVGRGPYSEAQATIGAMLRCLT